MSSNSDFDLYSVSIQVYELYICRYFLHKVLVNIYNWIIKNKYILHRHFYITQVHVLINIYNWIFKNITFGALNYKGI